MKVGKTAFTSMIPLALLGSALAAASVTQRMHVTVDISSIPPGDIQLELALYDNSEVMGDSYVLFDNVRIDGVTQADFETGTLEGFDISLNPGSVSVQTGAITDGNYVLRIDEDPVTFVTFTWQDFPGGTTLEFDVQMEASETVGFFGLDEFVVNVLDPATLAPLLPQLPPGGILSVTADSTACTEEVGTQPVGPQAIPTVSEWGLITIALLLLTGITIALRPERRRQREAAATLL